MASNNHGSIDQKLFFGLLITMGVIGAGYLAFAFVLPERYTGYAPTQPIPFSHKLHAGKLKINCNFTQCPL